MQPIKHSEITDSKLNLQYNNTISKKRNKITAYLNA
jgi:hypothetical protein